MPNVAAWLQNLAPANAVVISAVTARLVQGAFALEELGTHTLHGVAEPMAVSRVRGLLATPSPDEKFVRVMVTVLVAWEDLHWADSTTLEVLGLVIEQVPTVPMLHVLTYRPEFSPPWPQRSHMTPIVLNRLERPQVEALITQRAGGKTLPAEVVQHIVTKTDGVPLFVEELTKMLLESSLLRAGTDHYALTSPLSAVTIPATLQDSLMARLDRLPTAREVAQLGAVLGREFACEVLQAVSPWDEDTLQRGLHQLVATEFLYQRGVPPQATYTFKHALIQDVAYQSLLRSTRQQYHQRIAQALEAQFPETVATQPELVVQHYTAAGCAEQAVVYWQRAGQQASDRSAHVEAISHCTNGIELLKTLPETPARTQHTLTLHVARRQEAKSLELRAAMSLSRLWQQQGKQAEAHALLAPVYGWFTEGFDTADLQGARALLEALV